ncbi:MAG TPA: UDP-glucose 4-epimerase GalE [Microbacteriaceae bacterium]|nr:UDP-glucose 4-epimerase GalE [Microbacteriaceae bacterium]
MTVLVTGGAGYIGAHAVRALLGRGDDVVIVDDLSTGVPARNPGVPIVELDLSRPAAVEPLARALDGVDAVLHFAALKRVDESFERPEDYERVNVGAVRTVLEAMSQVGTPKLVLSSTAAVYGDVDGLVAETAVPRPVSPYGETKLRAESLLEQAAAVAGIAAASLRYFNVAGASAPELVEEGAMNLIPQALRRLRAGERPQIFGDDYPTPDGTCVRDFVHVADVADAHLAVLDALDAPGHRIYNLGTGTGSSVREVVEALVTATGSSLEPEVLGRRDGDPAVVVADVTRIRHELGWSARHDLADIVASVR